MCKSINDDRPHVLFLFESRPTRSSRLHTGRLPQDRPGSETPGPPDSYDLSGRQSTSSVLQCTVPTGVIPGLIV